MRRTSIISTLLLAVPLTVACVTSSTVLAPGADKVRLTSSPADVANCKAVGNLGDIYPTPPTGFFGIGRAADQTDYYNIIRNKIIGLGGNAGLIATGAAIAYQCP